MCPHHSVWNRGSGISFHYVRRKPGSISAIIRKEGRRLVLLEHACVPGACT